MSIDPVLPPRLETSMSVTTLAPLRAWRFDPLKFSSGFWLSAMLIGQWAFLYYLIAFYGASVASGDLEAWNRLAVFGRSPYVPGDTAGNAAFAGHALGAAIVALGGGLQLLPWIRSRFPAFHRWNGRVFVLTVLVLSASGFYLVWVRGTSPTRLDAFAASVNGLLITGFACATYLAARNRDYVAHREWALRLYLVSNGQWFLRVGGFAYFGLMNAAGGTPEPADLFFQFWTLGCFVVPLALLQLYLIAGRSPNARLKRVTGSVLGTATLTMVIGIAIFAALCRKIITGAPVIL